MAHIAGLVAAGEHPSPVPYADVVTSTTHKTLRGPRGGLILCKKRFKKAIDKAVFPGTKGGPLMHIMAAKAVCFHEAMRQDFRSYQHQVIVNAHALAKALVDRGLKLVSGGTDTHLMLLDLTGSSVTGKDLQVLLESANITANKNAVPFDPLPPATTSGLRLGTPAITTRGMKAPEMDAIAGMIADIVANGEQAVPGVKARAIESCAGFPLYS
jgi:glycine hydroxymethyltransferase